MAVSSVKARIEILERQVQPSESVTLDLALLDDGERAFIREIGTRCESPGNDMPDLSLLTVDELRHLRDLVDRYAA